MTLPSKRRSGLRNETTTPSGNTPSTWSGATRSLTISLVTGHTLRTSITAPRRAGRKSVSQAHQAQSFTSPTSSSWGGISVTVSPQNPSIRPLPSRNTARPRAEPLFDLSRRHNREGGYLFHPCRKTAGQDAVDGDRDPLIGCTEARISTSYRIRQVANVDGAHRCQPKRRGQGDTAPRRAQEARAFDRPRSDTCRNCERSSIGTTRGSRSRTPECRRPARSSSRERFDV
jgi:hypothetical protein